MRTVNVYLTSNVCKYLADASDDLIIEQVDSVGGILVHSAASVNEEGSGVWVDADGEENYGPSSFGSKAFAHSEAATRFLSVVENVQDEQMGEAHMAKQNKSKKQRKWEKKKDKLHKEWDKPRRKAEKAYSKLDKHLVKAYKKGGHLYKIPQSATPIPAEFTADETQ